MLTCDSVLLRDAGSRTVEPGEQFVIKYMGEESAALVRIVISVDPTASLPGASSSIWFNFRDGSLQIDRL